MKIYVDFNGAERCASPSDEFFLDLTGFGTLASLSRYGIQVQRNMQLTFADIDGLSVTAPVEFDRSRMNSHCSGWYAKFKKVDLAEGTPVEHNFESHLCFKCRREIKPYLNKVGQQFDEHCPYCGTSVMAPLLPPQP
jgi:hypothetical protein